MSAADFAALFGTDPSVKEELPDRSVGFYNDFFEAEDDDDDGAEWD